MTDASSAPPIETDALIIGAGPVGLFQVFQLGLQEVHAHVVDALPYAGGQCVELYADKPIYDIPGIAVCTGRELVNNLLQQIRPFKADFHFGQLVSQVQKRDDGRFWVQTTRGAQPAQQFLTKTLFIAAGVGAFLPRTLKVEGLDALEGTHLHYAVPDSQVCAGKSVVIAGDGDAALDAALQLCPHLENASQSTAARVTLIHRRDVFTAQPQTVAKFRERVASGHIHFVAGQITGIGLEDQQLAAVQVLPGEGDMVDVAADHLLVLQGLSPKLGPIAQWGLALERRQLAVNTENFSTSEPGIFAVGDVNTYPGKKKLILCGFHECVLAAFGALPFIDADKKVLLQYTTTSSKLHRLLGVENPDAN